MTNEPYEANYQQAGYFSFGKNWQAFLASLNEKKIKEAEESLIQFLGGREKIKGKSFIDVGCGSGLFSLAAFRLGAREIISVDVDKYSIACASHLRKTVEEPNNWEIRQGSALNPAFLKSLGTFDIVYSWGVLHHTGDMYQALKNIIPLVRNEGGLYIAIYNDNRRLLEGTSDLWLKLKKFYNGQSSITRRLIEALYTAYYVLGLTISGVNPVRYIREYHTLRGMDFMTDVKDWLGGYPYEYASVQTITSFYKKFGFTRKKFTRARSIGCNEFLFMRR